MCCSTKNNGAQRPEGDIMEYLVNIDGLRKSYDGFSLKDVSLCVPAGTVVGFIGSNGAGKTTTLKAALGLIEHDGGTVEVLGRPISVNSGTLDLVKEEIGVVLDTCLFPASLSVRDVNALGKAAYRTWDSQRFQALCKQFELPAKKKASELSRGMGMKLTLAFALAHYPQLLILDEATAGLDPIAREEVLDILRAFMKDDSHGILMSTHITSDLEKIADEVVCIDDGAIIFDLPKDAISDEAGIARCRQQDLEAIDASGFFAPGEARLLPHGFATDLLVRDRFAFRRAFPEITVDNATIEDYMTLVLKGETR